MDDINNPTTFTPEEFIEGKILEMQYYCGKYRAMAKTIGADTIADSVMGRGAENKALLKYIRKIE